MARFWQVDLGHHEKVPGYRAIAVKQLSRYPFPVLIGKHLKEITIFE